MNRTFYFHFSGTRQVLCPSCADKVDGLKVKIKPARSTANELILLLECDNCRAGYPFKDEPGLFKRLWFKLTSTAGRCCVVIA